MISSSRKVKQNATPLPSSIAITLAVSTSKKPRPRLHLSNTFRRNLLAKETSFSNHAHVKIWLACAQVDTNVPMFDTSARFYKL